jgi:hypothetical protein
LNGEATEISSKGTLASDCVSGYITLCCVGVDTSERLVSVRFNPANSCQLMVPLMSGLL